MFVFNEFIYQKYYFCGRFASGPYKCYNNSVASNEVNRTYTLDGAWKWPATIPMIPGTYAVTFDLDYNDLWACAV